MTTRQQIGPTDIAAKPHRLNGLMRLSRALAASRGRTLAALGIAALGIAAVPFARAHLQAIAVLDQVAGQPVPRPIAALVTEPIQTSDFAIPIEAGSGQQQQIRARLYLPAAKPNAPTLIVFHGVHHLGIDEPRLVSFARAMASCGIRVVTPELPGIKDYQVNPDSVRAIGESAKWFATHSETGVSTPVGVLALSFSGGLALVAAADPQYHPYFKFVFAIGSQYAMDNVAAYYTSGRDPRPDGTVEVLPAHEYGPLVLEYEHLEDFVPAADLLPVRAVLRARLYEDKAAEAQASLALSPRQKLETLELIDTTLLSTRTKIDAMIARHADELPAVSPRNRLRTLATPVYLLHGEADNIIPSAETLWIASELPSSDLKALLVSPILSHIDITGPNPTALDKYRLIHLFALVLRATEAQPDAIQPQ
jgi:pimeloyl-ACP methyl ester carboxylesterase